MLIQVGYDIVFEHPAPTPLIAMLYLHAVFGNRCGRLLAPAGPMRFWNDAVVEDSGQPDRQHPGAEQHEIYDLPDEALQFLMASRYCEVDRMVDLAWQLFGSTPKKDSKPLCLSSTRLLARPSTPGAASLAYPLRQEMKCLLPYDDLYRRSVPPPAWMRR